MRTEVDIAVARLAATQYGVFSYRQVLDLAGGFALTIGAAQALVRRRRHDGLWERVGPAVYRLPGSPLSWEQDLMIAVLDAGEEAVVSHRAAALVWGLDGAQLCDRERQNRVVVDGWRVLRLTWHDVTRLSARVATGLRRALGSDMRH